MWTVLFNSKVFFYLQRLVSPFCVVNLSFIIFYCTSYFVFNWLVNLICLNVLFNLLLQLKGNFYHVWYLKYLFLSNSKTNFNILFKTKFFARMNFLVFASNAFILCFISPTKEMTTTTHRYNYSSSSKAPCSCHTLSD